MKIKIDHDGMDCGPALVDSITVSQGMRVDRVYLGMRGNPELAEPLSMLADLDLESIRKLHDALGRVLEGKEV